MMCPWCSDPRCRPSRPHCKRSRARHPKARACRCDGYHYPHRIGSPFCSHNPQGEARIWALYFKLDRADHKDHAGI